MKLNEIYEGWRNKIIPPKDMKELIDTVSKERLAVCSECEWHSSKHKTIRPDAHCIDCGCTLSAKTKCLSCSCPMNKWLAVVTEAEEEEIKNEQ